MPRPSQPAGHRSPSRLTGRLAAAVLVLLTAVALVPAQTGHAEPGSSISDARRELEALNADVDRAVEDYATTQIALAAARRRAAAATARVAREEARLRGLRAGLSQMVGAIYMRGGGDQLASLVTTASPTDFLDRAATLNAMARLREQQLRSAAAVRRRLRVEQARALAAERAVSAMARSAARAAASIEDQVVRQGRLLNQLESAQVRQARLAREARLARQARQARQVRASRDAGRSTYTGSATGRASVAVQAAYAQLGKPYKWAADGPDSFDCSGLTMYVWAKAGVSLPHSSRAQRGAGRSVSRAEIRPGDLVFRGSPRIHHVGIYIGDGKMISAPQTGDVVKISNAFAGEYVGAVRL